MKSTKAENHHLDSGANTQPLLDARCHLIDPRLQRPQLLDVFVAGLVVGGNGSGDGRECNACGGRISISGGLGQLTGSGSVVQAHKATVDSASSIGLNGHIDGNLLDDGFALLADDADAVDVLRDDLDGGLGLTLADGGGLQGLFLGGGIPLRLNVARALDPAEANERDSQSSDGQPAVWPRNQVHGVSPMHCRYSASRRVTNPPHSRALAGCAQSLPWKKRQRSSSAQAPA